MNRETEIMTKAKRAQPPRVRRTPADPAARVRPKAQRRDARETCYRLLFNHSSDGVLVIDPKTLRILDFNTSAHRLLGYSHLAFSRLTLADIVVVPSTDAIHKRIDAIRAAGRLEFDGRCRTRRGEMRDVQVIAQSFDMQGRPTVHAICRDVTRQREVQAALAESEKRFRMVAGTIDEVFWMVDLLNGRVLYISPGYERLWGRPIEELHRQPRSLVEAIVPEDRQDAQEINKAAERGAALSRQLLAFGRKQVIHPMLHDLNSLVQNTQRMLLPLLGEAIELVTDLQPGLKPVNVDAGQIEQVLVNLAVNARDAMPNGGRLAIRTNGVTLGTQPPAATDESRVGAYVCLAVSDQGEGMSSDVQRRIFEPFFTTKPAGKGTGLGLPVAYGIARQHGGWIGVESSIGRGSTFTLYLPADLDPSNDTGMPLANVAEPVPPRGRGERILLVEDDGSVRELGAKLLREAGYEVQVADSAAEAGRMLSQAGTTFHLLFVDVGLPDGNGRKLAEQAVKHLPQLAVLLCSGYGPDRAGDEVAEPCGFRLLPKPYIAANLLRAVDEQIAQRARA